MELALKYGYSENHIRSIVGAVKPKTKHGNLDGQITMDEMI
jgi:hypothetical protein